MLLVLSVNLPRRVMQRGVSDGVSMVLHSMPMMSEHVWHAAATAATASASRGSAAAATATPGSASNTNGSANPPSARRNPHRWSWKAFRVALGLDSCAPGASSSLAPPSLMQRWQAAARECERSWDQEARQRALLQAAASSHSAEHSRSSSNSLLALVGGITKVDEGDETQSDDENHAAATTTGEDDSDAADEDAPCCFELPGGCFVQQTPSMLRICPVTFPSVIAASSPSLDHDGSTHPSSATAEQRDRDVTSACAEIERQIVRPAAVAAAGSCASRIEQRVARQAGASAPSASGSPLPYEFFFSPQVGVNCSDDSRSSSCGSVVDRSQQSAPAPIECGSCSSCSDASAASSLVPFSTFDQAAVTSILRGARLRRVQSYECEGALISVHFGFEMPPAAVGATAASEPFSSSAPAASDRDGSANDDRRPPRTVPPRRMLRWSPPLLPLNPFDPRVLDFSVFELAEHETVQIVEMHRSPSAAASGEAEAGAAEPAAATECMWLRLYTDAERRCDLGRPRGRSTAEAAPESTVLGFFQAPSNSSLVGIQGLLLPSAASSEPAHGGTEPAVGSAGGLAQVQLVFGAPVDRTSKGDTPLEQRLRKDVPLKRRRSRTRQPREQQSPHGPVTSPADASGADTADSVFDVGCIPLTHLEKQQQAVEFITASIRTSPSPPPVTVASST